MTLAELHERLRELASDVGWSAPVSLSTNNCRIPLFEGDVVRDDEADGVVIVVPCG